jgi:hypothetical protein
MRNRECIYQDILRFLRGRADQAQWRADRARAEIEASHIAVILPLLRSTDERRHRHYLVIEKPRYVRRFRKGDLGEFDSLWAELAGFLPPPCEQIPFAAMDGPVLLDYFSHASHRR